jgi:site-specific recombinase XerD
MVRAMAIAAPDSLQGLRDRALLLLGFAGAFRRSELVALDVGDVEETDEGFASPFAGLKPIRKAAGKRLLLCAAARPAR